MAFRPAVAALVAALAFSATASATPLAADGFVPPRERAPRVFSAPLDGLLYSNFGSRWGRLHAGVDIAVLGTDVVRAPADGVVVFAGWKANYSGYGLMVELRHEGGIETMYAHLARSAVGAGEYVGRGEPLGQAGCTGSCTGPHLHFEVRVRGKLVNPLRFLPKKAFG